MSCYSWCSSHSLHRYSLGCVCGGLSLRRVRLSAKSLSCTLSLSLARSYLTIYFYFIVVDDVSSSSNFFFFFLRWNTVLFCVSSSQIFLLHSVSISLGVYFSFGFCSEKITASAPLQPEAIVLCAENELVVCFC